MRSPVLALLFGLLTSGMALAQPAPVKPALDVWESVFARDAQGRDQQIGFAHLLVEPITVDEQKLLRSTRELRLTIKRGGQLAQLRADTGTEETPEGKVVGVFMRHWLGQKQALNMAGKIDSTGKKMNIKVEANVKNEVTVPWEAGLIGLYTEANLLRDKKVKPGDKFTYRIFEPSLTSVATISVVVKEPEEILLPRGGKKKLLRVESTPAKIQEVQLPASTIWADPETLEIVMTRLEMPDFGLLTLQRSTEKVATGPLGDVPDLMKLQTVRLPQRITGDVHNLSSITFKITLKGDGEPEKVIKADDRQKFANVNGQTFELTVEARRSPRTIEKEAKVDDEFIKSNHFINSDDENVKKLAERAVGKVTDPWEKAKAIERWVRANMKAVDYSEAMATADHVAKTLAGDCSEYSMLTAAMCKAQGIPARTALGVVYVDSPQFGGPALAFHMWTEVYVKGQWLGLDSTLGRGGIGPGHIKITDHSWHEIRGFNPLLPVTGFILAKPSIEIKAISQ